MAGPRCIEKASPERVRCLLRAANVYIVRERKTGVVLEIQMLEAGDDSRRKTRWSNPQALSTKHETHENPRNVWMLKRMGEAYARQISRESPQCVNAKAHQENALTIQTTE